MFPAESLILFQTAIILTLVSSQPPVIIEVTSKTGAKITFFKMVKIFFPISTKFSHKVLKKKLIWMKALRIPYISIPKRLMIASERLPTIEVTVSFTPFHKLANQSCMPCHTFLTPVTASLPACTVLSHAPLAPSLIPFQISENHCFVPDQALFTPSTAFFANCCIESHVSMPHSFIACKAPITVSLTEFQTEITFARNSSFVAMKYPKTAIAPTIAPTNKTIGFAAAIAPIIFKLFPTPTIAVFRLLNVFIIAGIPLSCIMNAPNAVAIGTSIGARTLIVSASFWNPLIIAGNCSANFVSPFSKAAPILPKISLMPPKPASPRASSNASMIFATPRVIAVFIF